MIRERFDRTIGRWHTILEALPEHGTSRVTAFMTVADAAAAFVAAGVDATEAGEKLARLACAHGLDDPEAINWIIDRALHDQD